MRQGKGKEGINALIEYGPAVGLFVLTQIISFDRFIKVAKETNPPIDQLILYSMIIIGTGAAFSVAEYGLQKIMTFEYNLHQQSKSSNSVE